MHENKDVGIHFHYDAEEYLEKYINIDNFSMQS